MEIFTNNLDELLHLCKQKVKLVAHLKKNYRENIHYIMKKDNFKELKKNGGQNKITFMLTDVAFDLLKNTYNLRNRYIVEISDKVKYVNIGMCIENQTIGFIENSYSNILKVQRQYTMGKYRVDLYFIDHKLVIECDENNHIDRDPGEEKVRENYIISLGNKIIRYNPNIHSFDLSNVLREINSVLFSGSLEGMSSNAKDSKAK